MKKILIIILAAVCLGTSSCDLDVTPENSTTITGFFKDEQDYVAIMNQMFSFMKSMKGDAPTHDLVGIKGEWFEAQAEEYRNFSTAFMNSNYLSNSWGFYYNTIYMANVTLDNAHRNETMSQDRHDFYIGQAHFAKAMAYLMLSQDWGEVIITKNSLQQTAYAKSSLIDVINESISDALKAFDLLPVYEQLVDANGARILSKQYGCKGNIAALLAHAYAWKGSLIDLYGITGEDAAEAYGESVYWATELIEGRVGSSYRLEENPEIVCKVGIRGTNIQGITSATSANSNESIFEFETDYFDPNYTCYTPISRYATGWPVNKLISRDEQAFTVKVSMLVSGAEEMFEKEKDMRLSAYFYNGDDSSDRTEGLLYWNPPIPSNSYDIPFAYTRKLREGSYVTASWGDQYWRGCIANWVYWRLADIHLLRAECNAKLGNSGPAIADINVVRGRAGASLYPGGPHDADWDLQYAVFKERERELLFEGHRYYDVVRNGYHRTEFAEGAQRFSEQDIKDGALFLPIHSSAFTLNDILRQNRYWIQFE